MLPITSEKMKYGLGKLTMMWIEKWPNKLPGSKGCDQGQKVQLEASHQCCTAGINLGPVLFHVSASDPDDGTPSADDAKLGEAVDTAAVDGCAGIHMCLVSLEMWVNMSLMKFNRWKFKSCTSEGITK